MRRVGLGQVQAVEIRQRTRHPDARCQLAGAVTALAGQERVPGPEVGLGKIDERCGGVGPKSGAFVLVDGGSERGGGFVVMTGGKVDCAQDPVYGAERAGTWV
jgi:hypothetical protein